MDPVALLDALAAAPVSGAALSRRFGVSRAMIWKGIEQLRAEGLPIEAERSGYRLGDPAQAFGPATLSWRCQRPVSFHVSCASTNQLARELGRGGARGSVVVADHQTGGRGRRGRSWLSPPGQGLLFSLLLHPAVPPQHAPRCVLQWAAAMAEVLDVSLKWPNDLVDEEGHKLGGILAELEAVGEEVRFVVLGVGLNIHQEAFPPELPQATSLRQIQQRRRQRDSASKEERPLDRAALLAALVRAIEGVDVSAAGEQALSLWRARAQTLGRRVRIGEVEGVAEDIREDGALLVDGRAILTGDVELIG